MKTAIIFTLLLILTIPSLSQKRYFYSSINLFKELDQPFPAKRKQARQDYVFNFGVGANFGYGQQISKKLMFNIQGGFWYFFNNKTHLDILNREIKYRNIVTPIIGRLKYQVIDNQNFGLALGFGGGLAYLQKINKFNDQSITVSSKWTPIIHFEITLALRPLFRKARRLLGYKDLYTFSYMILDKKYLGTAELELPRIAL